MRQITIASRGSKLALRQADIVKTSLEKLHPDIEISIVKVTTKGDRDKSDFLYKSQLRGLFTSEVEKAVLDGRADLAVHSLKDLPTAETAGLVIAAIPERQVVADALIASKQLRSLSDLPPNSTVGTSSLRRIAQLHHLRADLNTVPLRGNVETRVSKVASGNLEAVIVACAGLYRLGLEEHISAVLDPEEFLTAPGQAALAIQIRTDDAELMQLVCQLDDKPTRIAVEAERCVLAATHGGCSIPLGVYARIEAGQMLIDAMIADVDGGNFIRRSAASPVDQAKSCAEKLAEQLLNAGGREILDRIRADQNNSNDGN